MARKELDQRDSFCRSCRAAYKQEHYAANRSRYIAQARRRKRALGRERTVYLIEFFKSHPCVDCGELDPVVLEFDHVSDDKDFNVSAGLHDRGWASFLAEIEKCEVVCANCHRRRTSRRRGALRAMLTEL